MNDALNHDPAEITEWGQTNRAHFNVIQTQCYLLPHRGSGEQSHSGGGVSVEESTSLDILGMKIQSDVNRAEQMFNVSKDDVKSLAFSKRCKKFFTGGDIRAIYTGQNKSITRIFGREPPNLAWIRSTTYSEKVKQSG